MVMLHVILLLVITALFIRRLHLHAPGAKRRLERGDRMGLATDLVQPTVGRNDLILLILQQHQTRDADMSNARCL